MGWIWMWKPHFMSSFCFKNPKISVLGYLRQPFREKAGSFPESFDQNFIRSRH